MPVIDRYYRLSVKDTWGITPSQYVMHGLAVNYKTIKIMENIITYAKKNNRKLHVVITGRGGKADSFNMTANELEKSVQRHCLWYNTMETSKTWDDFSMQINLLNGIKFDIMLY